MTPPASACGRTAIAASELLGDLAGCAGWALCFARAGCPGTSGALGRALLAHRDTKRSPFVAHAFAADGRPRRHVWSATDLLRVGDRQSRTAGPETGRGRGVREVGAERHRTRAARLTRCARGGARGALRADAMDGRAPSSSEGGRGGGAGCPFHAWGAPIARGRPHRVLNTSRGVRSPLRDEHGQRDAWPVPREEGEEAGASSGRGRDRTAQHSRGARRRHGCPSRTARSECDGLPPGRAGTGQGQHHQRGRQGASNAGRQGTRGEGHHSDQGIV